MRGDRSVSLNRTGAYEVDAFSEVPRPLSLATPLHLAASGDTVTLRERVRGDSTSIANSRDLPESQIVG